MNDLNMPPLILFGGPFARILSKSIITGRLIPIVAASLSVLFIHMSLCAQKGNGDSEGEKIDSLLHLTYNCQFEEAQTLVDQVLEKDSMSLKWNYFRGVVLLRSMIAQQDYGEKARFLEIMDRVVQTGEKRLAENPGDTSALFFTGGAYGFIGMVHAHDHSYWKAVSVGKKGIEHHEKLITISPNYYDAYLSLAVFHYYASGVPWYVKPILYIIGKNGDEDKAVEYASLVSQKGHLAVAEARYMLYDLGIRRKDYEQAINAIRPLARQFPNNHLYAIRACEILDYTDRYPDVIEIGKTVWDAHHRQHGFQLKNDSVHYVGICYCLGKAYSALGRSREAVEVFEEMIRDSMFVDAHYYIFYLLGKNYEKENDRENAVRCYRKVIEIDSSSDLAKISKERLKSMQMKGN